MTGIDEFFYGLFTKALSSTFRSIGSPVSLDSGLPHGDNKSREMCTPFCAPDDPLDLHTVIWGNPQSLQILDPGKNLRAFFPWIERFHGTLHFELASVNHTLDDEAPMLYCAQLSVSPKGHQRFFEWLDGGHIAEVIAQPGFLWARRIHLNGPDEEGWERYMMIYGQASRKTLEEYFNNPIRERFSRERESFVKDLRLENFYGAVELALNK
jgi:hypothetical protein